MPTVHATYEKGVFRPKRPVDLPEQCEVEFEPRILSALPEETALHGIYDVLAERYQSGEREMAARHNEHQPAP